MGRITKRIGGPECLHSHINSTATGRFVSGSIKVLYVADVTQWNQASAAKRIASAPPMAVSRLKLGDPPFTTNDGPLTLVIKKSALLEPVKSPNADARVYPLSDVLGVIVATTDGVAPPA